MSALNRDIFREIVHTRSRFFSIFVLVALAVAFLAGLRTTAPDMEITADTYLDAANFMDVRVVSTLGLTQEDVAALAARDGVRQAEGAYTIDGLVPVSDNSVAVKVLSLSEQGINTPNLHSGRMPEAVTECLVEESLLTAMNGALGDSITISTGDGDYQDALPNRTFTVVGTCDSPLYMALDRGTSTLGTGKVSSVIHLLPGAFSMEQYTDIYLTLEGALAENAYSDDYEALTDQWIDDSEAFADQRAQLRRREVVEQANQALADAQQEYDDAVVRVDAELADAKRELDDARVKLDDGWADWNQGWADLRQQVSDAQGEISDGETELEDALGKLLDGEAEYADGARTLADGKAEYQDGLADYQTGRADYMAGRDEYEDGLAEYQDGLAEYEKGKAELEKGKKELDDAKEQLEYASDRLWAGQQAYNDGVAQYDSQKAQFDAQVGALTAGINAATGGSMTSDQLLAGLEAGDPTLTGAVDAALAAGGAGTAADLVSGKNQLSGALAQLNSSANSLSFGWDDYHEGFAAYTKAKKEYEQGVKELDDAWAKLEDARVELADAKAELDDGWETLDQAWAQLEHARIELEDGQRELDDARKELDDGWTDYETGKKELADAKQTLTDETAKGIKELADGESELRDGEADYADGVRKYEEGRGEADGELADARKALADARKEITELDEGEWYLLGRNTNIGFVSYQQDAERMGNLAAVFPMIFFLVAALVCLTTMTRMVEEQRVQIGSLKALGYSKAAIAKKYVGYGLLASLSGGLVGLAVGCTLIPWIIITAWRIMYSVPGLIIPIYPGISLFCLLGGVASTAVAVLAAALTALRATPASLMRPRAPKAGKRVLLERIRPLWRRLSFSQKVTVRNLFRYKKRFWMTVIGIGGCTALIVTGFGLRDSILSIMDLQYDEIYAYNATVGLDSKITDAQLDAVTGQLADMEQVSDFLPCRQAAVDFCGAERTVSGNLVAVPDDDTLSRFVHLRHRSDHTPVELPADGLVLTEKLAELLDVKVGDQVVLDGDDRRVTATVVAITEHYIMHYAYLTDGYYQQLFGHPPEDNVVLLSYEDQTQQASDAVSSALVQLDGVTSVNRVEDTRSTFTSSLESVDYAVVVVIISAAALAFVVLYNLTNINITERMRELATLKVLGFYERELNSYVFRESVWLTVFGVAIGLVMGKLLHQWLVLTVEIDMLMFGRSALPVSYGYAVILTFLFSLLVNQTAKHKLRKIDMVESLKTVE